MPRGSRRAAGPAAFPDRGRAGPARQHSPDIQQLHWAVCRSKKSDAPRANSPETRSPFCFAPRQGKTGRPRLFSHGERQLLHQKLSIALTRVNAPAPERYLNPRPLDASIRRTQTRSGIRQKWKPPGRGGYMPDRLRPPDLSPSQIMFTPRAGQWRDRSPSRTWPHRGELQNPAIKSGRDGSRSSRKGLFAVSGSMNCVGRVAVLVS